MDEIDRLRRENAELRRLAELRSENDALRQQLELPPEPPPQQKEVDAAVAALEAFESFERAAAPPDPPDDDAAASPARAARSPRAFAPRGSAGAAPAPQDDYERRAHMYANALMAIYERHNPDKLESIPSLLAKWEGREDELLFKARERARARARALRLVRRGGVRDRQRRASDVSHRCATSTSPREARRRAASRRA